MCRESKITVLRQAVLLQHVFSDLQTLPIKLLQMSCLIPAPAWQQLRFQSPLRQHCPPVLSSEIKHSGGAASRLREEQKGCKAYYREGNAEPSFTAWAWSLHLLCRSSMHKTFFAYSNIFCTIKAALQAHFFLHPVTVEQRSSNTWLVSTPSQEIKVDFIPTTHIHLLNWMLTPAQCTGQQRARLCLHWVKPTAWQRQPAHFPSAIKTDSIWDGQIFQHAQRL